MALRTIDTDRSQRQLIFLQLDRAKRKCVFEHAQNAQIHIYPKNAQSLCGHLLSIDTFYIANDSVSWQRRPWSDCADMPEDKFSHGAAQFVSDVRVY